MPEPVRRTVALKVLRSSELTDDRRRRFLREARAAAAVTHPNVATVYEVSETDGVVCIVMEYVRGTTLRAVLSRGQSEALREEVERLAEAQAASAAALEALTRKLSELDARVAALEAGPPRRRRWLG